jgi:surfactin synthase thioesterase subunit
MKLFCFPFAGGSAVSYRPLQQELAGRVDVVAVELPGRGSRMCEAPRRRLGELTDDVLARHGRELRGDYALFGHSMGATIAAEVARRQAASGHPPRHLFAAGRQAPSLPYPYRRSQLPREEFLALLRRLGGCPDEVLESRELVDLFEPILRADFEAVETYVRDDGPPIDVPVTVMLGEDDEVSDAQARAWQRETTRPIRLLRFPGNHFFLFEQWRALAELIAAAASVRSVTEAAAL